MGALGPQVTQFLASMEVGRFPAMMESQVALGQLVEVVVFQFLGMMEFLAKLEAVVQEWKAKMGSEAKLGVAATTMMSSLIEWHE